jgi:hypothetical protein
MFLLILLVPRKVFSAINLTTSDLAPQDDHFQITAVVSGMSSSSGTFIQGVFTPKDASKYFGYTFSKKGEWVKYESSPEKNFVLDNYVELQNDQPVTIFLKPDYEDKDYSGPGKYLVKLKRFTASGSPSDYSNTLEVDLNYAISTPQPTPTSTPTPTTIKTPTSTQTPVTPTKTPTPTPKITTPNPTISAPSLSATSTIRSTAVLSPASQAGQVLSTTSSEIYLATSSTQPTTDFSYDLNLATPSSSAVSDKTLFVIGASIFSLSGSLLYFRLKNL